MKILLSQMRAKLALAMKSWQKGQQEDRSLVVDKGRMQPGQCLGQCFVFPSVL